MGSAACHGFPRKELVAAIWTGQEVGRERHFLSRPGVLSRALACPGLTDLHLQHHPRTSRHRPEGRAAETVICLSHPRPVSFSPSVV